MTDQHPLTDEICEDLPGASCITIITAPGEPDPYICPQYIADDMRAAADWQLEQVKEWLRDNLQDRRYSGIGIDVDYVIEALAQDMRPTTTQQYVETPREKLKRLIEEGADKDQLLEAFNQLEDN